MTSSLQAWTADLGLVDAVLATVLALVQLTVLNRRARRGARWPDLLCTGMFGAYLIVLAMVVLCPLPDLTPSIAFPGVPDPPLFLVNTSLDRHGFLGQGLNNQNLQNLLLTVPFGFGLPFVVRWPGPWLASACVLLPVCLEGSQLLASLIAGWAYRSVDLNDVVANTAGGLLGLALFMQMRWLLSLTRSWPQGDPQHDFRNYVIRVTQRSGSSPDVQAQRRHAARTAAACAVAVAAVALTLRALGPAETTDYTNACAGAPPPDALRPLKDWTAYADDGRLCLAYPGGSTVAPAGSPDIALFSDERGEVTLVGQVPGQTFRVVVTLPDGRSTEAQLHPLDGLTDWLTYSARIDPDHTAETAVTIDPTTVKVESHRRP